VVSRGRFCREGPILTGCHRARSGRASAACRGPCTRDTMRCLQQDAATAPRTAMEKRSSEKAALITGASRGIGRAIALRLAAEGASLYLAADGTEGELEAVASGCREAGAPDAFWGTHDLAQPDASEAMVEQARRRLGRIDILVNNAGMRVRKPFGEFSHAEF